jgi:hypothetical protein
LESGDKGEGIGLGFRVQGLRFRMGVEFRVRDS